MDESVKYFNAWYLSRIIYQGKYKMRQRERKKHTEREGSANSEEIFPHSPTNRHENTIYNYIFSL